VLAFANNIEEIELTIILVTLLNFDEKNSISGMVHAIQNVHQIFSAF